MAKDYKRVKWTPEQMHILTSTGWPPQKVYLSFGVRTVKNVTPAITSFLARHSGFVKWTDRMPMLKYLKKSSITEIVIESFPHTTFISTAVKEGGACMRTALEPAHYTMKHSYLILCWSMLCGIKCSQLKVLFSTQDRLIQNSKTFNGLQSLVLKTKSCIN